MSRAKLLRRQPTSPQLRIASRELHETWCALIPVPVTAMKMYRLRVKLTQPNPASSLRGLPPLPCPLPPHLNTRPFTLSWS